VMTVVLGSGNARFRTSDLAARPSGKATRSGGQGSGEERREAGWPGREKEIRKRGREIGRERWRKLTFSLFSYFYSLSSILKTDSK
jgi:hypothetical protein